MLPAYDPWLVALSILVAVLVSCAALQFASQAVSASRTLGKAWTLLGATTMGFAVWSTHFIGMLAFSLPVPLRYEMGPTAMSLAIAMLTSGFMIRTLRAVPFTTGRHAAASLVMGGGIAAMHYTGMAAIPMAPAIGYDASWVFASVAIGVIAAHAAIWLAMRSLRLSRGSALAAQAAAAATMGLAIGGLHYTGMAAARFAPGAWCAGGYALDAPWLAISLAIAAFSLLAIVVVGSIFDRHLRSSLHRHAAGLADANERLSHHARHDPLTDLPNRAHFIELLQDELRACAAGQSLLAVLVVDLDRFKNINDSLGHGAGDEVLREMAGRLRKALGSSGHVARLGGDEFLLLARTGKISEVTRIAAMIVESVSRSYLVAGHELYFAASVGVTTHPFDAAGPEVLISHADEAMRDVKRAGGHGYRFFVPGTTQYTLERLSLENDLRLAAGRGELELHYQPVVDIQSGRICALEALVRWHHPERGWIPPVEFIPMAEASDLIVPIGRWIFAQACRQAAAWKQQGHRGIPIAVNLSAREFGQPALLDSMQQTMAGHGIGAGQLSIELTESALMSDAEQAIEILERLQQLGLDVAVDDFGTGYSSMNYLRQLPATKLKLDRSFINELGASKKNDAIVRAMVGLAHGLGMRVVAEGVESREQLLCLGELGCDQYQGYLFSKPVPAAAVPALLAKAPTPLTDLDIAWWLVGT